MPELVRSRIDWEAEIQKSLVRNRIHLDSLSRTEYTKQVNVIYDRIFDGVSTEINKLFRKASKKGKWIRSDVIKFNRAINLQNEIAKRLKASGKDYKSITRGFIRQTASSEFQTVKTELNDFQLIDNLKFFNAQPTQFLDRILAQPIQGLTYLERANKITNAQSLAMKEQIQLSWSLGESVQKTMSRVRKVNDIGRASAIRLVRTSVMSASNLAHIQAYKNSELIKKWRWSAALDMRTCVICGPRDGRLFSVEDSFLLPAHLNCRCVAIPYIPKKEWRRRGLPEVRKGQGDTRIARNPETGRNMLIPGDTTWSKWLRDQNATVQKEILGKGKWELWNKGEIKLNQLSPQRTIVPLKTLKKRAD